MSLVEAVESRRPLIDPDLNSPGPPKKGGGCSSGCMIPFGLFLLLLYLSFMRGCSW